MKKILIIIIIFFCLFIGGCGNDNHVYNEGFNSEEIKGSGETVEIEEIKKDYYNYITSGGTENQSLEEIHITKIYGVFDGAVVFKVDRNAFCAVTEVTLGVYSLTFSDSNTPLVWLDGEIYELKDAYDNKILANDDVKQLQEVLKGSKNE